MQTLFPRFRPTVMAAACAATTLSTHAGVLTEFTLKDDHTFEGSMSLNWDRIRSTDLRSGDIAVGTHTYNFIAQVLDVQASGEYLMGQSQAPVDTVMLVYRGIFDPKRPSNGFITGNDDYQTLVDNDSISDELEALGLVPINCSDTGSRPDYCPGLSLELEGGERYTVVISTYTPGDPLGYPQSFFVFGPDFVIVVGEDGIFEVPVEGSRNQPSGAYLDRVVNELRLRAPDSPVLEALATQAGLNEAERARFVQSMSSNVSRNGVRDASLSVNRSTLNTLGKRFASTGMGGQMGANLNLTRTLASHAAQQQMKGWQTLDSREEKPSILRYGDHDSFQGLVGALLGMDRWLSDAWLSGLFMGLAKATFRATIRPTHAQTSRASVSAPITPGAAMR